jgi:hypothetical protein
MGTKLVGTYTFTWPAAGRQADRQAGRQTGRQAGRQAGRPIQYFACSFLANTIVRFAVQTGWLAGQTGKIVKLSNCHFVFGRAQRAVTRASGYAALPRYVK